LKLIARLLKVKQTFRILQFVNQTDTKSFKMTQPLNLRAGLMSKGFRREILAGPKDFYGFTGFDSKIDSF
jgi:hypothetical protein